MRKWKSRREARADISYREQVISLPLHGLGYEDYEEILTVEEQREREEQEERWVSLKECFYCGWNYAPLEKLCRCVPYYAGGDGCSYGCDYCTTKHLWDDYDRMKREEEEKDEGLRILKLLGWKMGA